MFKYLQHGKIYLQSLAASRISKFVLISETLKQKKSKTKIHDHEYLTGGHIIL